MVEIKVEKNAEQKIKKLNVLSWPIWEKEVSRFEWFYDEREVCYFLAGSASVECPDGSIVSFGKGDLVTFPKGLKCVWVIKAPVRKHYNFG